MRFRFVCKLILAIASIAFSSAALRAADEAVPVAYKQGTLHGFLLLRSADGKVIATGDQTNVVRGEEIHAELVFHFRDGSLDDEVTDYRQGREFQLIRDHHVQKGPSFPKPLDMTIDVPAGAVTWQDTKDGKSQPQTQHVDMPADLMNGMLQLAVENFPAKSEELKVAYLVADPKPRVVTFSIKPDGQDRMSVGSSPRKADRYNVHIEIGGVAGAVAPIVGKQPADMQLWTLGGDAPVLVKMSGALYAQGPVWTMALTSPVWPAASGK